MNEPTNKDRAERADHVLRLYAELEGSEAYEDDSEALFTDLLADLQHWAWLNDLDYGYFEPLSRTHFHEELKEERDVHSNV